VDLLYSLTKGCWWYEARVPQGSPSHSQRVPEYCCVRCSRRPVTPVTPVWLRRSRLLTLLSCSVAQLLSCSAVQLFSCSSGVGKPQQWPQNLASHGQATRQATSVADHHRQRFNVQLVDVQLVGLVARFPLLEIGLRPPRVSRVAGAISPSRQNTILLRCPGAQSLLLHDDPSCGGWVAFGGRSALSEAGRRSLLLATPRSSLQTSVRPGSYTPPGDRLDPAREAELLPFLGGWRPVQGSVLSSQYSVLSIRACPPHLPSPFPSLAPLPPISFLSTFASFLF
jgi:hypothetical protein